MKVSFLTGSALCFLSLCNTGNAQDSSGYRQIPLNSLDAFRDPGKNWVVAADASADYTKQHDLRAVKGEGAVVNTFDKNNQMHLLTKEEFGDIDVSLDFMMARQSNAGVYLQGRYEIQLLDSWMNTAPGWSDAGAVYSRWSPEKGSFEGTAPYMNVSRAPGLWQHLDIKFHAPRFNDKGEKVQNARFETVRLNGVLVQQEVEVSGPTASSIYQDEKAMGPLVIQGDHGPVAIRNIRYRAILPPPPPTQQNEYWIPGSNYWNSV